MEMIKIILRNEMSAPINLLLRIFSIFFPNDIYSSSEQFVQNQRWDVTMEYDFISFRERILQIISILEHAAAFTSSIFLFRSFLSSQLIVTQPTRYIHRVECYRNDFYKRLYIYLYTSFVTNDFVHFRQLIFVNLFFVPLNTPLLLFSFSLFTLK